jgi:RNA polymerase sigma factor (sigma-70 family)
VGDGSAKARLDAAAVGRIFREESGRSLAALIGVFGDIDLAEDAVQEAFALALRKWPVEGLPLNPGGWITTTARNHALDRLRRESRRQELLGEVAVLSPGKDDPGMPEKVAPVQDDRLRLIFTCCHPALSTEAQVALTLRLLGGLSTREVASSFPVGEATMAGRLVRAKRKIKAARIPYRIPDAHELPDRLRPVLAIVYLIYNAGLANPAEPGLCSEAIRLARVLAALMPDEPEVAGLLALRLTGSARLPDSRPPAFGPGAAPGREQRPTGQLGCGVVRSPQALLSALRACTVVELEHPRAFADPTFPAHQPGFIYSLHRRHEPGLGEPRTSASGLLLCAEHSGTHIDALCHQAENLRLHGGIEVSPHRCRALAASPALVWRRSTRSWPEACCSTSRPYTGGCYPSSTR